MALAGRILMGFLSTLERYFKVKTIVLVFGFFYPCQLSSPEGSRIFSQAENRWIGRLGFCE